MPSTPADAALFARESALQAQADVAVADLGLDTDLAALGEAVRVGSSALGLMVRRDVDLTVVCPRLDAAALEAIRTLSMKIACHPRVRVITLRDDTGAWNTEPDRYPDGVYLGIGYRSADGADWNFDLWFVDEPDRQPDLAHLRTLRPRLTEQARVAILAIKQALADDPEYGRSIHGVDVYEAVLERGVATAEEFRRLR
jgi:hypothetical protein